MAGQCCDVRRALQNAGLMASLPRKLCCARTECELGALCVRKAGTHIGCSENYSDVNFNIGNYLPT